mmetsp:Transcript_1592/g.3277  ORF Transcript_1592/g.3277 Transcript_1592/m.3277 type:complete len:413 (-) Transcript_1592:134-1372(-)
MDFGKAVNLGRAVDTRRAVEVPTIDVPRDIVVPKLCSYNAVELRKAIEMCPAIKYIDDSALEAIVAAVMSGATAVGGIALSIVTAGAAIPSIALALIASTTATAGMVGVTYAASHMDGSFSWSEWAKKCGVAAGITVLTFGAGSAAGGAVTAVCVKHACHLSQATVEFLAGSAGALAGLATQGSVHCLFKMAEGEQIEGFELVVECAAGAMTGAAAGKLTCKTKMAQLYRGDRIVSSNRPAGPGEPPRKAGDGFHTKPQAVGPSKSQVKVFTSNAPVRYDDLPPLNNTGALASSAQRDSSILIVSGTHGDLAGRTLLDKGGKAGAEDLARFVQQDHNLIKQPIFDNLRKAGRNLQVVDLRNFAGEPESFVQFLRQVHPRPTCIVANFCYSDKAMDPNAVFGQCIRKAFTKGG